MTDDSIRVVIEISGDRSYFKLGGGHVEDQRLENGGAEGGVVQGRRVLSPSLQGGV